MIQAHDRVADVVTQHPKTADVFRQHGIDFCCGGQISIEEAAAHTKRVKLQELLDKLEAASHLQAEGINPKYLDVPSLVQYIQSRYHETLKEEFQHLTPYVTKLARVHGPNHPYLIELKEVYDSFKAAMLTHTDEEDHHAFPKLVNAYQGQHVEDLEDAIQSLVDDHTDAGNKLEYMRRLTNDYQPPMEACGTWRLVYTRLEALEKETHAHVHLENHILFPKVQQQ
ncbi:iron-sulfur cluster repair di-iron protein ScdA [Staphylococcus hyicus]|uniref:iron-sulfur cluster repair di-iron protein ScdA n=1 Tax=Staphylococcus hyicus TaxID=1284 RepID=UPI00208DE663|nr:iron-sulfur cluster repair di-iron protein ScdA [Staphylococcus hyicus]MCO4329264.1 iron-sulfur cluster repair di-iron protein ScdA [Staphylococcus hyicus]MCO4336977.1 iron-sulfur cluster repair di-iron protein ScdA [Staphylococcus hyicus]